ncbi:MAG TPA: VanZ family protein [Burkholderiales bacterium]|nr:VanZ family protein [Burkholderiales bacterium]
MRKVLVAAGWGWAAAIVGLSLVPEQPMLDVEHGDKAGHLAAYGLLMLWFAQLYLTNRARAAYAAGFVALGVALEFAQGALVYRSYDVDDMYANALGIALGWMLGAMLPPLLPRAQDQSRV